MNEILIQDALNTIEPLELREDQLSAVTTGMGFCVEQMNFLREIEKHLEESAVRIEKVLDVYSDKSVIGKK